VTVADGILAVFVFVGIIMLVGLKRR